MAAARYLLARLHSRGIAVHLDGERLRVDGATNLTDADRTSIVRHKDAIVAILRSTMAMSVMAMESEHQCVATDAAHDRERTNEASIQDVVVIGREASVSSSDSEHVVGHTVLDADTTAKWWRIHYADRAPLLVSTAPATNANEIQSAYPAAVSVEPCSPPAAKPDRAMTASVEAAIRAWLAHIDENNPAVIADVIKQCQCDADARAYFSGRARATQ